MTRRASSFAMAAAGLAASAIMVLWIRFNSVTSRDLCALAAQLHWWSIPAIVVLLSVQIGLAAARWSSIEEELGTLRPSFRTAFAGGAIALGLGTVLPGFFTNIAARAISNRLEGQGAIRGAVSGTADQLADLAIIALFIPAAVVGVLTKSLLIYLGGIVISAALGFASLAFAPRLACILLKLPIKSRLRKLGYRRISRKVLNLVYLLSLLRFCCLTAITLLVHFATDAGTSSAAIIAVPIVTVAIAAAMLPGGLGVSEWSFSALFRMMGIPHEQIVIFVLGNRVLLSTAAIVLMVIVLIRSSHLARDGLQAKAPRIRRSI